ncbi:MAG: hypothetical protein B6D58_00035 [candidate division Zixibacteria bacterium 4484_95]|nr:MAG: hypothetical protein B6D58_00035 [candidate division Zixibacteria bacterium 4484_95]
MNLTSLVIENFGKFKSFECDFTPGLNLIKGANETGKSTLVSAIAMALYGEPGFAQEDIDKSKTWGTDIPFVLKASISSDDFTGVLEKDFSSGQTKLINQEQSISENDKDRILKVITGAIGLPTAELFRATACIEQGEITKIGDSLEAIRDKLETLVTGGHEDLVASEVIAKIDRRIEDITRKDKLRAGLLQKLEEQQADIDYNIDKLEREINNIKSWRNSLAQIEIAFVNSREDYKSKKQQLEIAKKVEEARLEIERVTQQNKDISKKLEEIESSGAKVEELKREINQVVDISTGDRQQIEETSSALNYLRPKLRDLEKDVEEANEELDSYKLSGGLIGWMILSVVLFGFSIVDYLVHFTGFYFHLGGFGLISFMLSAMVLLKANQKRVFFKEQLNIKGQKKKEVEKEIEQRSEELKKLLGRYNISSIDQMHQSIWKRNELEKLLKSETERYQSLLDGQTEEQFKQKFKDLERKINKNKAFLEKCAGQVIDTAEVERLELIVAQLEEQNNNLKSEIKSLNHQIDTAEGGVELLASYLERKEEARAKKIKLVEELSVLSLTKRCIEKARQNVMISTLELLEKRTSEILEMITGGKYKKVRFDKSTLRFEVFVDDKRGWVDPLKELSRGTIEQIYLTARLALTEILSDKAQPPIILDDPFNNLDAQRLENTMKMLKQMSENRQILLLTSDDSMDSWADNIIQL